MYLNHAGCSRGRKLLPTLKNRITHDLRGREYAICMPAMQGRSYISAGACVRAPGLRCVLYACMHAGGSTMHACIGPHLYYYPGPRAFHVLRPRARHDLQHIIREKSRKKCRRKLLVHACPQRLIISAAAKRGEINFSARLCTRDVRGMSNPSYSVKVTSVKSFHHCGHLELYHPRCSSTHSKINLFF